VQDCEQQGASVATERVDIHRHRRKCERSPEKRQKARVETPNNVVTADQDRDHEERHVLGIDVNAFRHLHPEEQGQLPQGGSRCSSQDHPAHFAPVAPSARFFRPRQLCPGSVEIGTGQLAGQDSAVAHAPNGDQKSFIFI